MASGKNRVMVGSVYGTGSAINVTTLSFRPRLVRLFNLGGNAQAYWNREMPDAAMQKVVDSGVGTSDISYVTSNGITPLSNGFTIGADADLNASAELLVWEAFD